MKRMSVRKVSSVYAVILTLTLYLSLMMGFALPAPVQQIGSVLLLALTVTAGVLTSYLVNTANEEVSSMRMVHGQKQEEVRQAA